MEGNIGAGKTTFLQKYKDWFPEHIETIPEAVGKWSDFYGHNVLKSLYENPKEFSAIFQSLAQLTILTQQLTPPKRPIRLIERSIFSSFEVFTKLAARMGNLKAEEFDLLKEWINFLVNKFNGLLPSMVIYLRLSPEVAKERVLQRGREEESSVTLDYLTMVHNQYEEWLNDPASYHILTGLDMRQLKRPELLEKGKFSASPFRPYFGRNVKVLVVNVSGNETCSQAMFEALFSGMLIPAIKTEVGFLPPAGNKLSVLLLSNLALMPQKAEPEAVGFDLFSPVDVLLPRNQRRTIYLDVAIKPPTGTYGRIAGRSGLAAQHGINVGAGVIDPGYRGNIGVILFNNGEGDYQGI